MLPILTRINPRRLANIQWEFWLATLFIVIGILIRGLALGNVPPGLNQDEAASGYDSFALVTEGTDRTGLRFPVYLPSWGSGMNALAAYVTMPFVALLDLSPFSVRLPFFLAGIIGLFVFFIFLELIADTKTALIGLFLLALNPWHIMMSRWGLESNLFPTLFLSGVTLLLSALSSRKKFHFIASGVFFGLSLYAYGTSYAVLPVFLSLALATLYFRKKIHVTEASLVLGVATIVSLPIILFVIINALDLETIQTPLFTIPRLETEARFLSASSIGSADVMTNIWQHLKNFLSLLGSENDGLIWNAFPPYGLLGPLGMLLGIIGIIIVVSRTWKEPYTPQTFILLWIIAALPIALLTDVNVNRINIIFFPLIAAGAIALRSMMKFRTIFSLAIVIVLIGGVSFTFAYFQKFSQKAKGPFAYSFHQAIVFASEKSKDNICVTNSMEMPYIHVLFAMKTPPSTFAQTVRYENPGQEFQKVRSFGRYTFGFDFCDVQKTDVYIARPGEKLPQGVNPQRLDEFPLEQFIVYLVQK